MNTNYQGKSDDAESLTHKLRFAAVAMPLLGIVGGVLRMFGVPSKVTLDIIVPAFVLLFVLVFFRRFDRPSRHERVGHDRSRKPHQPRTRPAI